VISDQVWVQLFAETVEFCETGLQVCSLEREKKNQNCM